MTKKRTRTWRDQITVHPAAELFPLMSETDPEGLQAMAASIAKHPQQVPDLMPTIHAQLLNPDYSSLSQMKWKFTLVDGRNRLDAMQLAGIKFTLREDKSALPSTPGWLLDVQAKGIVPLSHRMPVEQGDPWEFTRRANIERRMLGRAETRALIRQLLKATPEKSDRAIGKLVGRDKNTIALERSKMEARGEIHHVKTRRDSKGRRSAARRKTKPRNDGAIGATSKPEAAAPAAANPEVATTANKLHRKLMGFQQTFTPEFKAWVETKPTDEGLDEIHNALRLVTEELLLLATSINEAPAPAAPAVTAPSKPPLLWNSKGEPWTGDMTVTDLLAHAGDSEFEIRQYRILGSGKPHFLVRVTIGDKLKTLQEAVAIAEAYAANPNAPLPKPGKAKPAAPAASAATKPEEVVTAAPAPRPELTAEESAAERKAQYAVAGGTALTVAPIGPVIDPDTGRMSVPERLEPKQSVKRGGKSADEDPLAIPGFLLRKQSNDEAAT